MSLETSYALDATIIKAALSTDVVQVLDAIDVFDSIHSTQEYVKAQTPSNQLCVAERQEAGKGRRGREWVSANKGDILLSLSWVYESVPEALSALSLAVVAEVAECIVKRYDLPIKIKWPNDLLLLDAKLAGFIVDVETGKQCRVTIGIGLNVAKRDGESLASIDQPITSLANVLAKSVNRNQLIAEIVNRLVLLMSVYPEVGFAAYQKKWESHAAYIGQHVALRRRDSQPKNEIVGVLEKVDEQGCLCVRDDTGELQKIIDSELSLRLL